MKAQLDPETQDPGASPDRALEESETAHRLLRSLSALPPKYREPVVLHYFMSFSIAETAKWLAIPDGTVKRRLHEARHVMKGKMAEQPAFFTVQLEEEIKMEITNKDLSGSSIEYADMTEASLRNVDFTGSTFEHVNISGVIFRHAGGGDGTPARDLTFEHCTMQSSTFRQVDLSEGRFEGVNFKGATLISCEVEGMTIDGFDVAEMLKRAREAEK